MEQLQWLAKKIIGNDSFLFLHVLWSINNKPVKQKKIKNLLIITILLGFRWKYFQRNLAYVLNDWVFYFDQKHHEIQITNQKLANVWI